MSADDVYGRTWEICGTRPDNLRPKRGIRYEKINVIFCGCKLVHALRPRSTITTAMMADIATRYIPKIKMRNTRIPRRHSQVAHTLNSNNTVRLCMNIRSSHVIRSEPHRVSTRKRRTFPWIKTIGSGSKTGNNEDKSSRLVECTLYLTSDPPRHTPVTCALAKARKITLPYLFAK